MSPVLKFWFCNVELDTQVSVDIDRSLANNALPFFVAFTSTADPESVYPSTWLAVQGTLHLQIGNVPTSVAWILLLFTIANDLEKPPDAANTYELIGTLFKDPVTVCLSVVTFPIVTPVPATWNSIPEPVNTVNPPDINVLPVTCKLPLIIADPVKGNTWTNDAVVANEALVANDADTACRTKEAVKEFDEVTAF